MMVRVPAWVRKLELLNKGIEKHAAHDRNFDRYGDYALVYPDGTEVLTLPGKPAQLFQLDKYKEDFGKPYNRITLFLVERETLEVNKEYLSSDSDEGGRKSPIQTTLDILCPSTSRSASTETERCPSEIPKRRAGELQQLKDMFPAREEHELMAALNSTQTQSLEDAVSLLLNESSSLNDAYASLLSTNADDHSPFDFHVECDIASISDNTTFSLDDSLQEKLKNLKEAEVNCNEYLRLKVRRQHVWEDTLHKLKCIQPEDLSKQIKIQFIGEPAVDQGGPSREFFSLINSAAQAKLMSGTVFRHNVSSLQGKDFLFFGQLTALRLMHGSPGPKCFSKSAVDYILGSPIESLEPDIDELANIEVKQFLQNLDKITDEEEFKREASFNCEFRYEAGYSKPFIQMKDKDEFFKSICLHYTVLASISEINQFVEGLKTCKVLKLIRELPEMFRKVFQTSKELTAEEVDACFKPDYSPKGSNRYESELNIMFNFNQYLEDIERGKITTTVEGKDVAVSLKHVLQFVTGADNIPAIGFTPRPTIQFSHDSLSKRKMTANTCGNILTIHVTGMSDLSKFEEEFTFCMMNSPGFGIL